jgi:uncharacterized protein DUF2513
LLAYIEEHGSDPTDWVEDLRMVDVADGALNYHVWLLADAGYIEAIDLSSSDGMCWRPRCLTSRGHDFLETVRSKDVWEKTLELAKAGGIESLGAIYEIGKRIAQKKLENMLERIF